MTYSILAIIQTLAFLAPVIIPCALLLLSGLVARLCPVQVSLPQDEPEALDSPFWLPAHMVPITSSKPFPSNVLFKHYISHSNYASAVTAVSCGLA
jgi:hypothetical protein